MKNNILNEEKVFRVVFARGKQIVLKKDDNTFCFTLTNGIETNIEFSRDTEQDDIKTFKNFKCYDIDLNNYINFLLNKLTYQNITDEKDSLLLEIHGFLLENINTIKNNV